MDIVFKEGMLYLQGLKFGKKTWRRTWLMLFPPTISGIGRVELYDMQDTSFNLKKPPQQKRAERRVVHLCDFLSITPAPEESCPPGCTALFLNTTLRTYTLASETCQDWIFALCKLAFQKDPKEKDIKALTRSGLSMEDNDLYSTWKTDVAPSPEHYPVSIQTTEASRRCKLVGDYVFSLDKEAVWLLDLQTAHVIYHWPFKFLRRFGQIKGGFSIEAGRRCDSGEGNFSFLSRHGPQIYQAMAKQCLLEQSTKPFSTQSPSAFKDCLADSYSESPMVQLPTHTKCPPDPPVFKLPSIPPDTAVEPASEIYATIDHRCASDCRLPAIHRFQKPHLTCSLDGEEGGYKDGDDVGEDSIYYNLSWWMGAKVKDQTDPERDFASSECIYSVVKTPKPPLPPQPLPQHLSLPPQPQPQHQSKHRSLPPQPQSQHLSSPLSQSLTHSQLQSFPYPPPKPRYQPQPQSLVKIQPHPQSLVKTQQVQPRYQSQSTDLNQPQEGEDTKGEGEAKSHSPSVAATVSFKQRLSEIISKDLAKLQSPLPSGASDSPPFSSY